MKVVNQKFTVVDLYESGMSEYDNTFAFVRLDQLQDFRGMINPETGTRSITTIQLKLAEGADLNAVRDLLRQRFPPDLYAYSIQTWRDMQGPLLAAVRLETTILNILLFLIIAVAGFGILSTFFMIVVEKTRDIGTLKALGASGRGVMSIFLSYGLLLGCVGSGVGYWAASYSWPTSMASRDGLKRSRDKRSLIRRFTISAKSPRSCIRLLWSG